MITIGKIILRPKKKDFGRVILQETPVLFHLKKNVLPPLCFAPRRLLRHFFVARAICSAAYSDVPWTYLSLQTNPGSMEGRSKRK
jgi:hypothetical protein